MYATSEDGVHFEKQGRVKDGIGYFRRATVVSTYTIGDRIYMTHTINNGGITGDIYLTYSNDGGLTWKEEKEPIISCKTVSEDYGLNCGLLDTSRMYTDEKYLYIFLGYNNKEFNDYPEGFIIARAPLSSDLMDKNNWELYPNGPIIIRGPSGAADEAAMWSFTPFKYNDTIYCYYEGIGTGEGVDGQGSDNSLKVRRIQYAGLRNYAYQNVMMCKLNTIDLVSSWYNKAITGKVKLRNIATGKYLNYDAENNLITSEEGNEFTLSFENNFFRIKGPNNYYVTPEIDKYSSTLGYTYKADASSNLVLSDKNILMSDQQTAYRSLRGLEWELYPVKEGCYKIQNRWTGCFMNVSDEKVNQSQETNDDTMLWEIETVQ